MLEKYLCAMVSVTFQSFFASFCVGQISEGFWLTNEHRLGCMVITADISTTHLLTAAKAKWACWLGDTFLGLSNGLPERQK